MASTIQSFCKNLCKGPAMKIEKARCQFYGIWKQNIVLVKVIKKNKDFDVVEGGDFYETHTPQKNITKLIWLNIQGVSSHGYERQRQGLVSHGSVYHAYALHNEDIGPDDLIVFIKGFRGDNIGSDEAGTEFVAKNHNKSIYNGFVAFQEFDLVQVGNG